LKVAIPAIATMAVAIGAVGTPSPTVEAPAPAACATRAVASNASPLATQLPVLIPRVVAWAEEQSSRAIATGAPIPVDLARMATEVGVRVPGEIRLVVVDEIPLPDEPALKAAAGKVGLSQSWAAGLTLGYAVFVRKGYEKDPRILSHEFRHVAQYEACGGVGAFMALHLGHLAELGYEASPFEVDARAHEPRED